MLTASASGLTAAWNGWPGRSRYYTGAICIPIDLRHPLARVEFILDDTAPAVLVTLGGLDRPRSDAEIVLIEDPLPAVGSGVCSAARAHPAEPALILYTSGSTGRPKGVLVTHGGLANLAAAQRELMPVTASDRVLQATSPSFDVSLWELGLAFGAGATCVLRGDGDLRTELADHRITVLTSSPSVLASTDLEGLEDLHTVLSPQARHSPSRSRAGYPRR